MDLRGMDSGYNQENEQNCIQYLYSGIKRILDLSMRFKLFMETRNFKTF